MSELIVRNKIMYVYLLLNLSTTESSKAESLSFQNTPVWLPLEYKFPPLF
jgi:hypothetical protein